MLQQTGGQIIETARLLGIARTTLWEKMKRLGITAG
jgi:transcriptional regulator of acetoin/glycerol metabolism